MHQLRVGTRVEVTVDAMEWSEVGRIEDIRTAAEFAPLAECGASRLALVGVGEYCFYAMEVAGEWYDMRQQKLALEIIGQYEWSRQPWN